MERLMKPRANYHLGTLGADILGFAIALWPQ
jgi:hypothetical protein